MPRVPNLSKNPFAESKFLSPGGMPKNVWIQLDIQEALFSALVRLVREHGGTPHTTAHIPDSGYLLVHPGTETGQRFLESVEREPPEEEDLHLLPYTYLRACIEARRLLDPQVMDGVGHMGLVLEKPGRHGVGIKIHVHSTIEDPEKIKQIILIYGGEIAPIGDFADIVLAPDSTFEPESIGVLQRLQKRFSQEKLHPLEWLVRCTQTGDMARIVPAKDPIASMHDTGLAEHIASYMVTHASVSRDDIMVYKDLLSKSKVQPWVAKLPPSAWRNYYSANRDRLDELIEPMILNIIARLERSDDDVELSDARMDVDAQAGPSVQIPAQKSRQGTRNLTPQKPPLKGNRASLKRKDSWGSDSEDWDNIREASGSPKGFFPKKKKAGKEGDARPARADGKFGAERGESARPAKDGEAGAGAGRKRVTAQVPELDEDEETEEEEEGEEEEGEVEGQVGETMRGREEEIPEEPSATDTPLPVAKKKPTERVDVSPQMSDKGDVRVTGHDSTGNAAEDHSATEEEEEESGDEPEEKVDGETAMDLDQPPGQLPEDAAKSSKAVHRGKGDEGLEARRIEVVKTVTKGGDIGLAQTDIRNPMNDLDDIRSPTISHQSSSSRPPSPPPPKPDPRQEVEGTSNIRPSSPILVGRRSSARPPELTPDSQPSPAVVAKVNEATELMEKLKRYTALKLQRSADKARSKSMTPAGEEGGEKPTAQTGKPTASAGQVEMTLEQDGRGQAEPQGELILSVQPTVKSRASSRAPASKPPTRSSSRPPIPTQANSREPSSKAASKPPSRDRSRGNSRARDVEAGDGDAGAGPSTIPSRLRSRSRSVSVEPQSAPPGKTKPKSAKGVGKPNLSVLKEEA
ncbi:hypothetical protein BOTBODRAFT_54901 [Botryobasidium botryosum FD-172 SS1]|uniref:BRCT domain-containing protein n=1 Tax=Botryobasidium botryosum (strain FD-172 SS1) TaxID=930990 RepID=A0A067MTV8_BOTB1|nr:hypothetical protein BOTBODRAFT_54901 [Botryobasidium botryosum FD-172 SS1]